MHRKTACSRIIKPALTPTLTLNLTQTLILTPITIVTLRAKLGGAVYCNRSCLWVCLFVCLWVCYHDNSKLRASILTKLGVGKGSDYPQLIKFWPSSAPRKGVCGGAKFFGSALLQPARSVCVSPSAFYAALLPRRGPHYASHSVCPSVRPSVPLSLPSVTSRHLANYNDTHVLFGTR